MKPRIAVFSGPTATVLNTPPLVTSGRAAGAERRGAQRGRRRGAPRLRPQRLAAPVTVYVEQFSAHPLESDAAELYGPPDGYVDPAGRFHEQRAGDEDVPVYAVELRPDDGLYPLPYVARRADGEPWDDDGIAPSSPEQSTRQPFLPGAERLFEEIDRLGLGSDGRNRLLSSRADFAFVRVTPPGGRRNGSPPEVAGRDYFPYRPRHLRREPPRSVLATITNAVRAGVEDGACAGALWLEGSPFLEETLYWLHLVVDATVPVVGVASPDWAHGVLGNVGDRNVVDAVAYVASGAWRDEQARDRIGAVLVHGGRVLGAREAQKADARGGGYGVTGGIGGGLGSISQAGHVSLSFLPARRRAGASEVRLSRLADAVAGVAGNPARAVTVAIRDAEGGLLPEAIPHVALVKYGRYAADSAEPDPAGEVEVLARIERNLVAAPLAGFVAEGGSPHGHLSGPLEAALERAVMSGMPVVKVGRGNADGEVPGERVRLGSGRLAIAAADREGGRLDPEGGAGALRARDLHRSGDRESVPAHRERHVRAMLESRRRLWSLRGVRRLLAAHDRNLIGVATGIHIVDRGHEGARG